MVQYFELFPQQALHQMFQYERTNDNVVSFFNKAEINCTDIFAVMLPLGSCPRCEGGIFQFFNDLTKLDSNAAKVLIAVYSQRNAALNYLKNKDYGVNKIVLIDSDDKFLNNFKFSTTSIQVPYIMKFSSGTIIKSDALLGLDYNMSVAESYLRASKNDSLLIPIYSTDFASERKMRIAQDSFCHNKETHPESKIRTINSLLHKRYRIDESGFKLSEISYASVSSDFRHLSLDDHLTSKCAFFEMEDSLYVLRTLLPDTLFDEYQFIDSNVPRLVVNYLKNTNTLHSIYNISKIIGDRIYISASLPNLYWEDLENEILAYYNEPAILSREIVSESSNGWNSIAFNKKELELASGFSHVNFYLENDLFFFPIKKGWPMTGTDDAPTNESENPSSEMFYVNSAAFNVYRADGSFVGTAGHLPDWHKRHKTGYLFFDPLVKEDKKGQLYVVDRHIGKVYNLDKQSLQFDKEFSLFDINEFGKSLEHKSIVSLDYYSEIGTLLKYQVVDFVVDSSIIYSLINMKDHSCVLKTHLEEQKSLCLLVFQKDSSGILLKPFALIQNEANELFVLAILREKDSHFLAFLGPFY